MQLDLSVQVEIRPLRNGDLDDLEWDSEQTIDADHVRETVAARGDEVVFLLALVNGRPVGRLGIDFARKADEGVVCLWAFGVLPALHRHGIGTAMMREAETLIFSAPRGASLVEIGAEDWNDEAVNLYRRLGYRDAGDECGSKEEIIRLLRRPISLLRED